MSNRTTFQKAFGQRERVEDLTTLADDLMNEIEWLRGILSEQLCNCGMIAPRRNSNPLVHQEWCRYRTAVTKSQQ